MPQAALAAARPTILWNGKTVSDAGLHAVLGRAVTTLGVTVSVTSGDRDHALAVGGGQHSLHLLHRAVDFHMFPKSDEEIFKALQTQAHAIFTRGEAYELIRHGKFTETTGPHIHIGHYPEGAKAPAVYCKVEGLTPAGKGRYPIVETISLAV